MTDLRQAAQQALESLEYTTTLANFLLRNEKDIGPMLKVNEAITALKAALEQQAEPVAVVDEVIHAAWSAGFVEGEKAALEQQAEPVAWGVDWGHNGDRSCVSIIKKHHDGTIEVIATEYDPKASTPLKRKPLTDEEIEKHWKKWVGTARPNYSYTRAIEAAYGITENT